MAKVKISGNHIIAASVLAKVPLAGSSITGNTRVLLSFGAAENGFEYAIAVRNAIMAKRGWTDKSSVFVDAISAKEHDFTRIKGNKPLNPVWSALYLGAIRQCEVMIFLVTKAWLNSQWCRQELDWWKKNKEKTPIIVLVFDDAMNHTDTSKFADLCIQPEDYIHVRKTLKGMDSYLNNLNNQPEVVSLLDRINHYCR